MTHATEIQWVNEGIAYWQAYEPEVKTDLSSCAVRIDEQLFLFDPIALAADAWEELTAETPAAAIVLTNGNHQRASIGFREKFHLSIEKKEQDLR